METTFDPPTRPPSPEASPERTSTPRVPAFIEPLCKAGGKVCLWCHKEGIDTFEEGPEIADQRHVPEVGALPTNNNSLNTIATLRLTKYIDTRAARPTSCLALTEATLALQVVEC